MKLTMKQLNIYKFIRYFSKYLNEMLFPLFVYKISGSIFLTLLYLFLFSVFAILSNFIFKKVIIKRINIVLSISMILTILSQFLIITPFKNVWLYILLMALITGTDNTLAYSTMEYLYNIADESENVKNIRNTFIVEIIALTLGPLCGGFIIEFLGKYVNAGISSVLTIIAVCYVIIAICKLKIKGNNKASNKIEIGDKLEDINILNEKSKLTINNEFNCDNKSENSRKILKNQKIILILSVILMAYVGVFNRLEFTFSIYLSILNISFLKAGIVSALITVGQIVFAIITYCFQLKKKDTILLIIVSIAMCVVWVMKPFMVDNFSLYFLSVLNGLIYPFLFQPIKYIYVSSLKKYSQPKSIFYMEEYIRQFGAMVATLLGLIFSFLGVKGLNIMIIASAVSYLFIPIISMIIDKLSKNNKFNNK